MAKKSRRARRQRAARSSRTRAPATRTTVQPKPAEKTPTAAAPESRKKVDFSAEYHYVISDLRSMAVIAVGMLAVLIALSFIIR